MEADSKAIDPVSSWQAITQKNAALSGLFEYLFRDFNTLRNDLFNGSLQVTGHAGASQKAGCLPVSGEGTKAGHHLGIRF